MSITRPYTVVEIGPDWWGRPSRVLINHVNSLPHSSMRYLGLDIRRPSDVAIRRTKEAAKKGVTVRLEQSSIEDQLPLRQSSVDEIHAHALYAGPNEASIATVSISELIRRTRLFTRRGGSLAFLNKAKRALRPGGKLFISGAHGHALYGLTSNSARWFAAQGFLLEKRGGQAEAQLFSRFGNARIVILKKL